MNKSQLREAGYDEKQIAKVAAWNDNAKPLHKRKFGVVSFLMLAVGAFVFQASIPKEIKTVYKPNDIQFLSDVGFTGSKTVRENLDVIDTDKREKYRKAFGLNYFSRKSMEIVMEEQHLVMGDVRDFNGAIPEENIIEFRRNKEAIESFIKVDSFTHFIVSDNDAPVPESNIKEQFLGTTEEVYSIGWAGDVLKENNVGTHFIRYVSTPVRLPAPTSNIKVAAPPKDFNMEGNTLYGLFVMKPIDPMILLEYDGGYLVLTSWFE